MRTIDFTQSNPPPPELHRVARYEAAYSTIVNSISELIKMEMQAINTEKMLETLTEEQLNQSVGFIEQKRATINNLRNIRSQFENQMNGYE